MKIGSYRLISVRSVVQLYPGPFVRTIRPADSCAVAGRFVFGGRRSRSNVPSNNPQLFQPLTDLLDVLRHSILHHLGAVPYLPKVGVNAPHHRLGFVPELARHGVARDRRPASY